MDLLFPALASLATSIPVLLVWCGGMLVAVVHLPRRPLAARLMLAGL